MPSIFLAGLLATLPLAPPAEAGTVRAVFFYSPTCPHCHTVMDRDLPPLQARWGDALQIVQVDVTTDGGRALYRQAIGVLGITRDRVGVPSLVVGEQVLVGSEEIPRYAPGLVEAGVAAGGVDWPALPGLAAFVEADEVETGAAGEEEGTEDAAALALAWGLLVALVCALGFGVFRIVRRGHPARARRSRDEGPPPRGATAWKGAADPHGGRGLAALLALLGGLGISAYLTVTTVGGGGAACGPLGDCAAVHASPFSHVAGVPVALLGFIFYLGVGGLWWRWRTTGKGGAAVLAFAGAGLAFSIYLTLLEVWVIRAVCIWCLGSAAAAMALWLSVLPGGEERGRPGAAARKLAVS